MALIPAACVTQIVYRPAPECARILRWTDGDTCEVECASGDGMRWREHVRIWGVDAPERGEAGYDEATEAARKAWPIGTKVHLRYDARHRDGSLLYRDHFGRLLAVLESVHCTP